jgi:hypothetical protein
VDYSSHFPEKIGKSFVGITFVLQGCPNYGFVVSSGTPMPNEDPDPLGEPEKTPEEEFLELEEGIWKAYDALWGLARRAPDSAGGKDAAEAAEDIKNKMTGTDKVDFDHKKPRESIDKIKKIAEYAAKMFKKYG